MTPGAHRAGQGISVERILTQLAAERHGAGLHPLPGPISDRIRPLAAAGEVGAQLVVVEEEHQRPLPAGDRFTSTARRPWSRFWRKRDVSA